MRSILLLLCAITLPVSGQALAARVVVIQSDDLPPYLEPTTAFVDAMEESVQVVNIHGRYVNARSAATRLKADPPEVFFCLGAKAAYTVMRLFPDTPFVYASIMAPGRYGIDGPRVSGITMSVPAATTISQYVSFFPDTKRIGIIRGPNITNQRITEVQEAAANSNVEIIVKRSRTPKTVLGNFHDMIGEEIDAVLLQADRETINPRVFRRLVDESRRKQIGLIVETENMVRAGALFAVVPQPVSVGAQAADMVNAILDGADARDLGVQPPRDAFVVLNLEVIRTANLSFDALLLDFVDITVD